MVMSGTTRFNNEPLAKGVAMSLPHDYLLQDAVMTLIAKQPDFAIASHDAVRLLQQEFPQLTTDEVQVPYRASKSHFANRVQWAAAHLKIDGWLLKAPVSGKGSWQFTAKARQGWRQAFPNGDELLAEMMKS